MFCRDRSSSCISPVFSLYSSIAVIPELIPRPAPEVSVNTRKGVAVNYAPSTIAG